MYDLHLFLTDCAEQFIKIQMAADVDILRPMQTDTTSHNIVVLLANNVASVSMVLKV